MRSQERHLSIFQLTSLEEAMDPEEGQDSEIGSSMHSLLQYYSTIILFWPYIEIWGLMHSVCCSQSQVEPTLSAPMHRPLPLFTHIQKYKNITNISESRICTYAPLHPYCGTQNYKNMRKKRESANLKPPNLNEVCSKSSDAISFSLHWAPFVAKALLSPMSWSPTKWFQNFDLREINSLMI